ncbi:MAG: hypothetical protein ACE37I_07825 [Rubinisphaera brasiliensis]|uniref:hypothetical protein n=1 Tax=Rubinisphaera brasiliensis TaxID=119 RepID=UPI0039187E5E
MGRLELDVTELIKTHRGQMFKFYGPSHKWEAWVASLREGERYAWIDDENREAVRHTILSRRGAYTLMRGGSNQGLTWETCRLASREPTRPWNGGDQKWGDRELAAAEHWDDKTLQGLIVETVAMRWLAKSTMAECVRYRERDDTWWFPLLE